MTDGDVVLVDRNCHKSLNYALNLSGAIPVYLMPRRNARGLIPNRVMRTRPRQREPDADSGTLGESRVQMEIPR